MFASSYKTIRDLQIPVTPDTGRSLTIIASKKLTAQWHTVDNQLVCRWELGY